jgi:hypothetical protein
MKTTTLVLIFAFCFSFQAMSETSCFFGVTAKTVKSFEKNKVDAYTLVYDVTKCESDTLFFLQKELLNASQEKLSYLKVQIENSQNTLVSFYSNLGEHKSKKESYKIELSRIQSVLALVQGEMNKRNL